LTYRTEDGLYVGHCVNVSASGMLAVFAESVELFTEGCLSLLVGEFYVTIAARVARSMGDDRGLAFHIRTDNDRDTVAILLAYAVSRHQPVLEPAEGLRP
jgi:hypothetical protein